MLRRTAHPIYLYGVALGTLMACASAPPATEHADVEPQHTRLQAGAWYRSELGPGRRRQVYRLDTQQRALVVLHLAQVERSPDAPPLQLCAQAAQRLPVPCRATGQRQQRWAFYLEPGIHLWAWTLPQGQAQYSFHLSVLPQP